MRYGLFVLCTVLLSGCAYLETNSRMQQFDDLQRGYARAMTWSNLDAAYSATRAAEKRVQADGTAFQDIKITSYEVASQKVEESGKTIRRIAQIRYVHTERMIERKLTLEEVWKYSEDDKRWILESGFPQFR